MNVKMKQIAGKITVGAFAAVACFSLLANVPAAVTDVSADSGFKDTEELSSIYTEHKVGWARRFYDPARYDWLYLDENYNVTTGWKKIGVEWYFFNDEGIMQTGWHEEDGVWYYLRKDGTLASNEWSRGYWVSKDGSWKYQPKGSWKKDKNGWWFGDTSGWYAKNQSMKIDGVLYTFDAEGYLVE